MFDSKAWQAFGRKLASPPAIMVAGALVGIFYSADHRIDREQVASVLHDPFMDSAIRLATVSPSSGEKAHAAVARTATALGVALRNRHDPSAAGGEKPLVLAAIRPRVGVLDVATQPVAAKERRDRASSRPDKDEAGEVAETRKPEQGAARLVADAGEPAGGAVAALEGDAEEAMGPPAPLRLAMTFHEPAEVEDYCEKPSTPARTASVDDPAPQSLMPIAIAAVDTDEEESGSGRLTASVDAPAIDEATIELAAAKGDDGETPAATDADAPATAAEAVSVARIEASAVADAVAEALETAESDALVGPEIPEAVVSARLAARSAVSSQREIEDEDSATRQLAAADDELVGPPVPESLSTAIVLAAASTSVEPTDADATADAEATADADAFIGPPLPASYEQRLIDIHESYELAMLTTLEHGSFVGPLLPTVASEQSLATDAHHAHNHPLPFDPLDEEPFKRERPVTAGKAPTALEALMAADDGEHTVNYVRDVEHRIRRGETLSAVLETAGLDAAEIDSWVTATRKHYNVNRIYPGQEMNLVVEMPEKKLRQMKLEIGRDAVVVVERMPAGVIARREDIPYERRLRVVGGRVDSSLYVSAVAKGIPDRVISDIAEVLGWDIDFGRDLRPGDTYRVIYEELTRTDTMESHAGRVLAAEVVNDGESLEAFFYRGPDGGQSGYFNRDGEGLGRAFLRYPVAFSRISSHFSKARYHPVLKKKVPHYGVDFAAPTGTPVKAVADGTISKAGWYGGNGRFVKIGHDTVYESGYAHLSRIAPGIKAGAHVKKGDVVGYVGSTGLATGPHLHFAMYRSGEYIDPLKTELPRSRSLSGNDLAAFRMKLDMMDRAYAEGGEGEERSTQVAALPSDDVTEPVQ